MLTEIFSRVGMRLGALFPISICEADFAFDASQLGRLRYQPCRDAPAPDRCAQLPGSSAFPRSGSNSSAHAVPAVRRKGKKMGAEK